MGCFFLECWIVVLLGVDGFDVYIVGWLFVGDGDDRDECVGFFYMECLWI